LADVSEDFTASSITLMTKDNHHHTRRRGNLKSNQSEVVFDNRTVATLEWRNNIRKNERRPKKTRDKGRKTKKGRRKTKRNWHTKEEGIIRRHIKECATVHRRAISATSPAGLYCGSAQALLLLLALTDEMQL
jgi:hypothetical protein